MHQWPTNVASSHGMDCSFAFTAVADASLPSSADSTSGSRTNTVGRPSQVPSCAAQGQGRREGRQAAGDHVCLMACVLLNTTLPRRLFQPCSAAACRHLVQDEEEGGKEQEDFKLRIAWQYRRYIKTASSRAGSIPASLSPGSSPGLGSTVGGRSGGGQAAVSSGGPSSSGSSGGAASRKPAGLRDWCHRFDLLRSAGEEGLSQCQAQLLDCGSRRVEQPSGGASVSSGTQYLLSQAAAFVQSLAPQQPAAAEQAAPAAMAAAGAGARAPPAAAPTPRGPQHVGRIAVLSLGSPGWRTDCLAVGADGSNPAAADGSSWRQGSLGGKQAAAAAAAGPVSGAAIVQWLLQLKGLVRDQRCAVVVSVPAAQFSAADVARMQHLADCVVAFESVADDSDIAR